MRLTGAKECETTGFITLGLLGRSAYAMKLEGRLMAPMFICGTGSGTGKSNGSLFLILYWEMSGFFTSSGGFYYSFPGFSYGSSFFWHIVTRLMTSGWQ